MSDLGIVRAFAASLYGTQTLVCDLKPGDRRGDGEMRIGETIVEWDDAAQCGWISPVAAPDEEYTLQELHNALDEARENGSLDAGNAESIRALAELAGIL
jgi:hypothetical protein